MREDVILLQLLTYMFHEASHGQATLVAPWLYNCQVTFCGEADESHILLRLSDGALIRLHAEMVDTLRVGTVTCNMA